MSPPGNATHSSMASGCIDKLKDKPEPEEKKSRQLNKIGDKKEGYKG